MSKIFIPVFKATGYLPSPISPPGPPCSSISRRRLSAHCPSPDKPTTARVSFACPCSIIQGAGDHVTSAAALAPGAFCSGWLSSSSSFLALSYFLLHRALWRRRASLPEMFSVHQHPPDCHLTPSLRRRVELIPLFSVVLCYTQRRRGFPPPLSTAALWSSGHLPLRLTLA